MTSVIDVHATVHHLLGLDHDRLKYFHNSRSYRLTDVADKVIQEILAEQRLRRCVFSKVNLPFD